MDLRRWLLDAHDDVRARLSSAVVEAVPPDRWHEQADGGGSSIAWLLLHAARHQDLAIATAVRDQAPLYLAHRARLGLAEHGPAAGLTEREDRDVARTPPPDELVAYLTAVFDATRSWLEQVGAMALDSIPDTSRRLERRAQLTHDEVPWLHEMWSGRTVHWLVQWPVLGHGHAHVGEAISVRNRLGLSPF